MEMMTNISKLTRQAGLAFAAVLWLGLNTAGISSARAADVSNTCAVQFHPCKIDGAAASRNLYPNSRIEEMQKGCLNTVPDMHLQKFADKTKKLQEPKKKSPKERPSATSEPPVVRTARPNTAHMALTCILNCVTAAREKVRFCLPPALRQMLCATATFRFRKHRLSKTIRIRKW